MIIKFSEYINEGIRGLMTPKPVEQIEKSLKELSQEQKGKLLIRACDDADVVKVKMLIDAGVDVNYDNNKALKTASTEGEYEITKLLLMNGADVNKIKNDHFAKRFVSIRGLIDEYKNK